MRGLSKYFEYLSGPTETEIALICDTARYISDITIGGCYLSPEIREQRIAQFWQTWESLSSKNSSQISAEQIADSVAYVAARATYVMGARATISALKNMKSVGASVARGAALFAERFMQVFDSVITVNPAFVTNEGAVILNASEQVATEARQLVQTFNGVKDKGAGKLSAEVLDDTQRGVKSERVTEPQKIGIFEKNAKHIFRNAEGHLPDTEFNRKLLMDVASDFSNQLGIDKYGTEWFARITKEGKQVWVGVRKGSIRYGGVNETPKIFNSETGLSRLMPGINNE